MWGLIELMFGFPAAIPEVWLNAIGADRTIEDEAHLAENPQRVDFVILGDGRKAVVEIDGPSHYADYNEETSTYTVSQDRYAKNLAVERSLRRQGWEIHRFANVEVERAADVEQFTHLVDDLPGVVSEQGLHLEPFTASLLEETFGSYEKFLGSQ